MSEYHKIRWRKSDTKELARLAKNFNAKIDYQLKKNPALNGILPDKVKVKDLKKNIASRNDLNRTMKKLSNFSKRGAEQVIENVNGEKTTLYQLKETQKETRRLNRIREKEYNKAKDRPVYIDGKLAVDVKRATQKDKYRPINSNFDRFKKGEFKDHMKYVEKKISDKRFEHNAKAYSETMKAIYKTQYSDTTATRLGELVDRIGQDKFLQMYYNGFEENDPDFQYDPNVKNTEKLERTSRTIFRELYDRQTAKRLDIIGQEIGIDVLIDNFNKDIEKIVTNKKLKTKDMITKIIEIINGKTS